MIKEITFFISRLEYTNKNEIVDMCFDSEYLIIPYKCCLYNYNDYYPKLSQDHFPLFVKVNFFTITAHKRHCS
jgi:hypothetical protein